MTIFVFFAAYAVVLAFVFVVCVRKCAVHLNGVLFFSVGFVYYWLLPYTVMYFLDTEIPQELSLVYVVYSKVTDDAALRFVLTAILYYLFFAIGYSLACHKPSTKKTLTEASSSAILFWSWMATLGVVFAFLMAIPVTGYFFKGYDSSVFEGYQNGVVAGALPRGAFVAATSILFVLSFMRAAMKNGHSGKISKMLLDPFMLIYYFFTVLVLSMGGRLYFATNVISMIIFFSMYFKLQIRLSFFLFFGLFAAGLASIWGVLRADGDFSFSNMYLNLAQEPLLTSISLFAFLGDGNMPAFNPPVFLASDFTNLLPSIFFPDKQDYLLKPQDFGYMLYNPVGAMHAFVSLVINFGVFGAALFFWALGFGLALFERASKSIQSVCVYSFMAAWLTFSFHRDPFAISIVKSIFQVSIFIPLSLHFFQKIWNNRNRIKHAKTNNNL
jgi:hypothetical protein